MRNTRTKGYAANHAEVRNKNTDEFFISEYYPINFVAGDFFVFFNTLYLKSVGTTGFNLAAKASRFLYGPMRNPTQNYRGKTNQKYVEALNFLRSAAEVEYIRETTFLEKYKQKSPELKSIIESALNSGSDKYFNLINAINIALKDKKEYEKELEKEIKRIETRQEILNMDRQLIRENRINDKGEKLYTTEEWAKRKSLNGDDVFGDTTFNPYFNFDGNKAFKSMFTKNSAYSIIAEHIITQYGSDLLIKKNNKLHLNKQQVTAMIKVLIQEAYTQLCIAYKDGVQKQQNETLSARKDRIQARLNEMTKKGGTLDKFFNDFMNSTDPASTLTSIAERNKIPIDASEMNELGHSTKVLNERIKKIWAQEKKAGNTSEDYRTWRKNNNLTKKEIEEFVYMMSHITVKTSYTNEGMAATDLAKDGFYAMLDSKNAPTDVNAGMIVCTFTYEENPEGYRLVQEAQKKMSEAQYRMLKKQNQITNKDSFKNNTKAIQEMLDEQKNILTTLRTNLQQLGINGNDLITHINIHETVKGYASINATRLKFAGAAFGVTISDQIDIINEMLASGGITPLDRDWLIFALINCGEGMIGSDNKHALEDYLSGYVGLLMFSDAAFIAQDVSNYMRSQLNTDISNIHLYALNDKYVPCSYILNETYKAMVNFLDGINTMESGTFLSLTTYKSPNSSAVWTEDSEQTGSPWTLSSLSSGAAWNQESQSALSKTHLTMYFIGNFIELLRNLAAQLSSI